VIKDMLNGWEKQYPGRTETLFSAIKNVTPSQLADTSLFNFVDLKIDKNAAVQEDNDTCATVESFVPQNAGVVQFLDASDIL
jgi:tRNA 2-thiocytidine biosynthesis protein TtcA